MHSFLKFCEKGGAKLTHLMLQHAPFCDASLAKLLHKLPNSIKVVDYGWTSAGLMTQAALCEITSGVKTKSIEVVSLRACELSGESYITLSRNSYTSLASQLKSTHIPHTKLKVKQTDNIKIIVAAQDARRLLRKLHLTHTKKHDMLLLSHISRPTLIDARDNNLPRQLTSVLKERFVL